MKNSIDCKAEEKVIEGTAFLIHVGTQQLSTYIEKKHYHVNKKVADTGSEWNPDTFFNPVIFWLEYPTLIENIVNHIHFHDHRQEINVLQQSCIIYLYFFLLADLNSLDTLGEHTCYLFLLINLSS